MAFSLGYIDVADISIGAATPGTFHVWRDEECADSYPHTTIQYKVRVTHPDIIRTSPSKGSLALGEVVPITVEFAGGGDPAAAQDKMRLMIIYSTEDSSAMEQKYKIPVHWTEDEGEVGEEGFEEADGFEEVAPASDDPPPPASIASSLLVEEAAKVQQEETLHIDPQPPTSAAAVVEPHTTGEVEPPVGSFDITFSVGSVECPPTPAGLHPTLIAGRGYHLAWKRSNQQGVLPSGSRAVPRGADGSTGLDFDAQTGSALIAKCMPEHKADGSVARRLLQILVIDTADGGVVGSVKFDTSVCEEGERSADVPLKTAGDEGGGELVDICLGMFPSGAGGGESGEEEETSRRGAGSSPLSESKSPKSLNNAAGAAASVGSSSGTQELLDRMKAQSDARAASPRPLSQALPAAIPTSALSSAGGFNPLLGQQFEGEEVVPAPSTSNVGVYVRVRPMLTKLGEGGSTSRSWKTMDSGMTLQDTTTKNTYTVDKVFPPESTNMDIFTELGSTLVTNLMSGLNGTLFMYGQTASGKTHTVFGSPGEVGQVNLLLNSLFQQVREATQQQQQQDQQVVVSVNVSYFEIYNEELNDLLEPSGKNLPVRANKSGGFAADVSTVGVRSVDEALQVLTRGTENKHMGQSELNDRSSRSHSIFQLRVKKKISDASSGKVKVLSAELNLVDLAGSETLSDTGDAANRKETAHINLSLTYLKKVIKELADEASFVSFRNSSLTKILKSALGGNSKTILICCVTAAQEHRKDTRNTLIFGTTAKTVKTTVKVNASSSGQQQATMVAAMVEEHRRLLDELHTAQEAVKGHLEVEEDLKQAQADNAELLRQLQATHQQLVESRVEQEVVVKKKSTEQEYRSSFKAPPAGSSTTGNEADLLLDDFEDVDGDDGFEEVTGEEGEEDDSRGQEEQVAVVSRTNTSSPVVKKERDAEADLIFDLRAEVQRLKQQNMDLKIQHREELREKEIDLATASDQIQQQQEQILEAANSASCGGEGGTVKASDEVAEIMQKEEKVRTLLDQIHQFLHWGTPVTLVDTSEGPKKTPKVLRRWLSLLPNAKGEISLALYGIKESGRGDLEEEPDRQNLIEKFAMSDCKRVIMGHDVELLGAAIKALGGSSATPPSKDAEAVTVTTLNEGNFHQTFSVVFRKKKYLHVVCRDHSDFEAWIVNLNKLLQTQAAWCSPLDLTKLTSQEDDESYAMKQLQSQASKDFCRNLQLKPSQYLYTQEKIAARRDRFITLFDIRSSAKLDLYHSQRLFQHMRSQGYIAQATLFYLTDRFAESLAPLEEGGEREPVMSGSEAGRKSGADQSPTRLQAVE